MRKDAIFRIYSMTKAVTGVAVMILHDEGKFALTDPVARYLPEFASPKVAVEENDAESGKRKVRLVDAERLISILDLLRAYSGINYQGPRDQDGESYHALGYRDPDANLEMMVKKLAQAACPSARHDLGLRLFDRCPGSSRRCGLGDAARPVLRNPYLPAPGNEGHRIRRPRVEMDRLVTLDTPGPTRLSGGPRGRPRISSRSRQPGSPAAADSCRPPATTPASSDAPE